jgi:hypothetical protein
MFVYIFLDDLLAIIHWRKFCPKTFRPKRRFTKSTPGATELAPSEGLLPLDEEDEDGDDGLDAEHGYGESEAADADGERLAVVVPVARRDRPADQRPMLWSLKYFFQKIWQKYWRSFTQTTASFCKNLIYWFFVKMQKICCHNINAETYTRGRLSKQNYAVFYIIYRHQTGFNLATHKIQY